MARRNISLPDELDERARRAHLNVSALAQHAVAQELDRQSRMAALDAWLDELDATHGAPSRKAFAEARTWMAAAHHIETRPTTGRPSPRRAAKAPRTLG